MIGKSALPAMAIAACLASFPALSQAASEKVVYAFKNHTTGELPNSPLVRVGGKFYGTTEGGGSQNRGTIYFVQGSGHHVLLYSFQGGTDGDSPTGGLVELGGILYGVTMGGGIPDGEGSSYGTIFSITPQGAYKQVYAFKGGTSDGRTPVALVVLGTSLYGVAESDGRAGAGAVFSVTPQGSESLIYSFQNGSDGFYPSSIITDGTMLYGTTELGAGTDCDYNGCGAIFMVDPEGNETTLHTFGNGDKGGNPYAPLLKLGSQLYGTTVTGGSNNLGTVFRLSLNGTYKDLHDFDGADGKNPQGGGLVDVAGTLYGTTSFGGQENDGTVFAVTRSGKLTTIYNFQGGADGARPGNLLATDGILYGTTQGEPGSCGKANPPDCGTVFAVTP